MKIFTWKRTVAAALIYITALFLLPSTEPAFHATLISKPYLTYTMTGLLAYTVIGTVVMSVQTVWNAIS